MVQVATKKKEKEESTPKSEEVVSKRIQIANELLFDAVPSALRAETRPRQIFWTALFIGGLFGLFWQLHNLYRNLESAPLIINLRQTKSVSVPFPDISVCAPQSLNVSKLSEIGFSLDITDFMSMATDSRNASDVDENTLEIRKKDLFKLVDSWQEFLDKFGIRCEDFFARCQVGWSLFDCCKHFVPEYTPDQGICFR